MRETPDWSSFVRERLALPGLNGRRERDIIEEIASQLEDLYLEALSRGKSENEADAWVRGHISDWTAFREELMRAERSRRRAKGDQWTDEAAESLRSRGGRWVLLADLLQDLRYCLRGFRLSPGFTGIALLTLTLGIGGVATVFTLCDQVLVRPLPYPESDGLVELWERMASFENASVSYPNFLDWRERNRVFEDVAVWNETRMSLTGSGDPEEVLVARVSASVFPLLRAAPVLGRTFLPEEDRLGVAPVSMLSHGFWEDRFGGDSQVIGQVLTLDGYPFEVVGVLPEDFQFPPQLAGVDLFAPAELFAEDWLENRGSHPGLTGLARLKPGVTLEQAREDMERVALELEAEYFDTNEGSRVHVAPLQERVTRGARGTLFLLLLAVSFLLLIACSNVANLVLARATGREQEMAVRVSLGADRARIVRLLLTETLVLWLIGGTLGLVLAYAGVGGLTTLLAEELPPVFRIALDMRATLAVFGLSLGTAFLFGLPPALRVVSKDLRGLLKEGRRATGGVGRSRFRAGMVVGQVSLAVALLVGSGLTLRSVFRILKTDTGLDPSNVLTLELSLPESRYPEATDREAFFTRLLDQVRALPSVTAASTSYVVPLGPGGWQNAYHVEGTAPQEGGEYTFSEVSSVSSDYFRTMGIPSVSGRDFTREDNATAPGVIIVDEEMVARYWPGENPLGKRVKWGGFESDSPWMEVVGVVGHVAVNGVTEGALPQLYIPHWQDNDNAYYLMVKSRGEPHTLLSPLRDLFRSMDPSLPMANVRTMDTYVDETTRSPRLLALLMTLFSAVAVLLAAVGMYGVMSQLTAERRHEIGVRVALGARKSEILGLVFKQGFAMAAVGTALGLGFSLVLGKIMAAQLFQVTPTDPLTFMLTPFLVFGVAITANLLPARRAVRMDPVRALQSE